MWSIDLMNTTSKIFCLRLLGACLYRLGLIVNVDPIIKLLLDELNQPFGNRIGVPFATGEKFHQ